MKNIKKIMLALALSIASMPAAAQMATPTQFIPTVVSEQAPLRIFANLNSASMFSSGMKDGKFNLNNMQLNLGVVYNVGMGLDVGFGLHGGMFSPAGMFRDRPTDVAYTSNYGMMFGADVMVRYLAMMTDMFYAGIQAQVGYNYTDMAPGAPDSEYTKVSKGTKNSFIPVVAGIVLGADFASVCTAYLFPAIELGQTVNSDTTKQDTGVWKSDVGMQINAGLGFKTGIGDVVVQLTPRMADFNNSNSWGMNYNLGMAWNF